MPDGDKKDDLFEDLDKFFAPIQDVDWPENPAAGPPREEAQAAPDTDLEEPVIVEPDDATEAGATPGQEGLFEGSSPSEAGSEESGWGDEESVEISEETFGRAPSAYVDLPGASEEDEGDEEEEPVVGSPVLEASAEDEQPSPEAVEAAAEHFAESVRDEADLDPEDETSLPELLGGGDEVGGDDIAAELEEPVGAGRAMGMGGTEGLGGPSWQEPTTMEVGLEQEARRTGRDVPAAFITGLALAGVALGSLAVGKWAFALVAGAIVLWAQGELYLALQRHHLQPATALGLVSGGLVLGAGYFRGEAAMLSMFVLSVFATFLWYMAAPASHRRGAATNIGVTVLGIAYVPLMASYALAMLDLTDGRALVLSVIGLTFVYDTAAFIVGSWWGNRPLAPTISPKKSLEGAIGATLVVIAVSVGAVAPAVTALNTVGKSVALAVVVAVLAPLGDLAESLIKRDLGVKDMGSILPGHGGVLDRIDSVLFVAPAAFLFLRLIFP
ncbi:MAG: phosphatidate cytidylyltransferase [Actinobacteria bacterium]|nr:MAG: phosphatidate cytidylyltransferase [Actinomycetota bacterium]